MKKYAIALVSVLIVTAACSSSSTDTGSSGTTSGGTSGGTPDAATPAGNTIAVTSNKFVPSTLTVKVGDTVTWTWMGGSHSVTSGANCVDDKTYGMPITSAVGTTFTHTYDKAGTFEFFCIPHCSFGMKGTITVQ